MNIAIVLSGGIGSRMGLDVPKQYVEVAGMPIICYSLKTLDASNRIDAIWIVAADEWLKKLFDEGMVATRYVDADTGLPTMDEEWNVNGSYMAIEGITSADGRIYGKMAHAERIGDNVAKNIYGNQDMKLFESGVKYFA